MNKMTLDYYFHPDMKGRTSIKKVLPAVWNNNAWLHKVPWFSKYHKAGDRQILPLFTDTPRFLVHQNRLYIETARDQVQIQVYSPAGDLLQTLSHRVPPLALTENDRQKALAAIRNDRSIAAAVKESGGWDAFGKRYEFHFPPSFPAVSDMVADGDRLYIQTFETRDEKTAYLILDTKGKLLRKVFLPTLAPIPFTALLVGQEVRLYKIHDGIFSYLEEDEAGEHYELKSEKI